MIQTFLWTPGCCGIMEKFTPRVGWGWTGRGAVCSPPPPGAFRLTVGSWGLLVPGARPGAPSWLM